MSSFIEHAPGELQLGAAKLVFQSQACSLARAHCVILAGCSVPPGLFLGPGARLIVTFSLCSEEWMGEG